MGSCRGIYQISFIWLSAYFELTKKFKCIIYNFYLKSIWSETAKMQHRCYNEQVKTFFLFQISDLQFQKQMASHARLCLGLTFTALRLPLKKFFTSIALGNKLFKIQNVLQMFQTVPEKAARSSLVPFRSFRISNHAICRFWWSKYATIRGSYE